MRQELPDTSLQGSSGTSFLESAIVMAKAGTPPYVASATQQQDKDGSSTETPPVDLSVKQRTDEGSRRTTKMTINSGYYCSNSVPEKTLTEQLYSFQILRERC